MLVQAGSAIILLSASLHLIHLVPLTILNAKVVWVSTRANTEAEVPPDHYANVVLLDYADGCSAHQWAFP